MRARPAAVPRGLRAFVFLTFAVGGLGAAWAGLRSGESPAVARTSTLDLAKTAFAERRLARGEELARAALAEDPRSREAKVFLGAVLLERGRLPEALRLFQELLRADGNDLDAVRGLGLAALGLGREQEAVLHLSRVARARAEDAVAWKELARAQQQAGDALGAMTSARTSLSLDREQADLEHLVSELAGASLRPKTEEAAVRAPRPIDPHSLVPRPQVPDPSRHFPKPEVRR